MKWLDLPADEPPVLFDGQLTVVESDDVGDTRGEHAPDAVASPRELPRVSVGRPQAWPLVELLEEDALPATLRWRLTEYDYYLVRLSCSFRVAPADPEVEWARFSIALHADGDGHQPLAVDLHPLLVAHEVQRDVKVALKPTLKFGPVDLGSIEASAGFQYTSLEPEISAAGVGESAVSWDYQAIRGFPLRGSTWMHLLVEAPTGMTTGEATIDLAADLVYGSRRLPTIFRRRDGGEAERLTASLWAPDTPLLQ